MGTRHSILSLSRYRTALTSGFCLRIDPGGAILPGLSQQNRNALNWSGLAGAPLGRVNNARSLVAYSDIFGKMYGQVPGVPPTAARPAVVIPKGTSICRASAGVMSG